MILPWSVPAGGTSDINSFIIGTFGTTRASNIRAEYIRTHPHSTLDTSKFVIRTHGAI